MLPRVPQQIPQWPFLTKRTVGTKQRRHLGRGDTSEVGDAAGSVLRSSGVGLVGEAGVSGLVGEVGHGGGSSQEQSHRQTGSDEPVVTHTGCGELAGEGVAVVEVEVEAAPATEAKRSTQTRASLFRLTLVPVAIPNTGSGPGDSRQAAHRIRHDLASSPAKAAAVSNQTVAALVNVADFS